MATKNVQFNFNSLKFREINGVAMGSPLGKLLANIFVGYDENILLSGNQVKPHTYCRYFNDVFDIFQSKNDNNSFFTTCTNA